MESTKKTANGSTAFPTIQFEPSKTPSKWDLWLERELTKAIALGNLLRKQDLMDKKRAIANHGF